MLELVAVRAAAEDVVTLLAQPVLQLAAPDFLEEDQAFIARFLDPRQVMLPCVDMLDETVEDIARALLDDVHANLVSFTHQVHVDRAEVIVVTDTEDAHDFTSHCTGGANGDRFAGMQRVACLSLVLFVACGGGTETGEASLSVVMPPVKSAAAKTFTGADGAGNMVLGWKIELYADGAGADCTSEELDKVATVGIYTNKTSADGPQAMLNTGGITIVTQAPPMVLGAAAANLSVDGVSITSGLVSITEYHLTADAKTADRIAGMINAGGMDAGTGADVTVMGTFIAPVCEAE